MAIRTQLSPIALPGKRYSFSAKTAAGAEKGAGPFTQLSVMALPGAIQSFSAKTPAIAPQKGEGLFTALSVIALPGQRQSFLAKEAAEEPEIPDIPPVIGAAAGGGLGPIYREEIRKDIYRDMVEEDQDILEIIIKAVLSGILE